MRSVANGPSNISDIKYREYNQSLPNVEHAALGDLEWDAFENLPPNWERYVGFYEKPTYRPAARLRLGWTAIILESGDVSNLVESEIRRIGDRRIADRIRELAVVPYPVERSWDYGEPGERYTCWTVLEHAASNTGIAYCLEGFGPADPWGLVFLSGPHMNIGMDSAWFASLEDAFRESMAWDEPPPEGFELQ